MDTKSNKPSDASVFLIAGEALRLSDYDSLLRDGPAHKPFWVLIAESSEMLAETFKKVFESRGYKGDTVFTAEEALRALEQKQYDIALLDYHLPDWNENRLLDSIQTHQPECISFVTALNPEPELPLSWIRGGATVFVSKPCNPEYCVHIASVLLRERMNQQTEISGDREQKRLIHLNRMVSEAREELQQREKYYRTLIHSLHEDIMVIDRDYRITDLNNALLRTLEMKREEVVGKYCHEISHGQVVPCYENGEECGFRQVFATGAPCSLYHRHITSGGEVKHIEILMSPLKDDNENITHVVEASRDISEIIKIREALLENENKCRCIVEQAAEERERLIQAIEQSGEMVVITDTEGTIQYVNPVFTEITGYTREEVIGQNPRILKSGEQDDAYYRELWETISNGSIWNGRIINKKKNGSLYTEEVTISPVFDVSKKLVNYVAVKRDITEQRRLRFEKERIEGQYRQAQRVDALARKAGNIAHELNNQLFPILGYSEILLENFSRDDERRELVSQIINAGFHARDLVRQLQTFSRKETAEYRPVDLNKTIRKLEKLFARIIREEITIEMDLDGGIPYINGDSGQIEQVIMNLVVNAQDAMPDGGTVTFGSSMVEIDGKTEEEGLAIDPGKYVVLSIRDTGFGMDEETLKNIFEPFFTTKGEMGTGMGLSMVDEIIREHGGSIRVKSEPNKGTEVEVFLPVFLKKEIEMGGRKGRSEEREGTETILLVEDNDQVRALTCAILKREGYTILQAGGGDEAIAMVEEYKGTVHLLLTDVIMPEMDGKELYSRIAKTRPEISVLYMSGFTDDIIAHRGVLDEDVDFIQKPFTINGLLTKVREKLKKANN